MLAAAGAASGQDKKMVETVIYDFDKLPVRQNGQNRSRAVFNGENHAGFPIELHMTELAPGQMPHPAHKHVNEEVTMIKKGTLEVYYGGKTVRATEGSIIYMASMVEHGWKNVGTETAVYFVIALGPKTA